ncbi:MAG TPA: tetratricopeptide repeat protein [Burkholderiales bacterium]|nr:tetratricopeptide repeat protein [Burkholderiales bacterium]
MAVYDLEEQEQIDALKSWWRQNQRLVIAGVSAVAIGFAGFQGWQYYRTQRVAAAAQLYAALKQAVDAKDAGKIKESTGALFERYATTLYAPLGALLAAKASFEAGDKASAKVQLQWVIEHAREEEMQDTARLRLGAVLLDEKNYAEALKLADAKHADSFDALYSDLKGDILTAQGQRAEARAAYQAALDKSDTRSPYRSLIQLKLDALGDAK